ncbi:glycosyltransferase family 2 protein [Pontibacter sp. Tf4]|uniref:glycosyltransferase family 2 protein n=1 Tax=Pontibacter sp. Tf4 TaxID=2761620 RepID=UPI001626A8F8|nr:glycosyltransferase family 2 protein [Pontibacter sp. Tf4]MBB6611402.1 glycosyltransferase family 2 protein [Pontibacter sp. Tf4]
MSLNRIRTSLLISTYNWPAALELCLKSILNQVQLPDEVLIADDGSGPETKALIDRYRALLPVPVKHIWHPDNGFQLAAIRNKAIVAAAHEYIIQIDGDLILHPYFVKDHLKLATPNRFVSGSRLLLPQAYSEELLATRELPGYRDLIVRGNNRLNAIRIPVLTGLFAPHYKRSNKYYVKGCNMAFWRQDLLDVNGYNESIVGWGKEDSEIAVRLINKGVHRLFIKFGGICYHIYHKIACKKRHDINEDILQKTIDAGTVRCQNGIDAHFAETVTVL